MEVPRHRPGVRLRPARHRAGLRAQRLSGDGDGWVTCALGHRHWGRYGAAGLLIRTAEAVVLQHRAPWSHHGGTWGLPGGARDSHESVSEAALREAAEEAGIDPESVRVTGLHTDDHGGWSYTAVLAEPITDVIPVNASAESVEVGWQPVQAVHQLPLHPGFAATWPTLRPAFPPPHLVVDAANVVGSRPDGWWHERSAAALRLYDQLAVFVESGLEPWSWPHGEGGVGSSFGLEPWSWPYGEGVVGSSSDTEPGSYPVVGLSWLYPRITMVVEGAARSIDVPIDVRVDVVRASGSGDDAIVDVVRRRTHAVVVTADRELRRRVGALGADTVGPRWLWTALGA